MSFDKHDQFEFWLMDMDDAIERFQKTVPQTNSTLLDFSPESLIAVEAFVLARYAKIEDTRPMTEAALLDGAARYVGQVFRKHLGGKWVIEFKDDKNAFYGLPQLAGMAGQRGQVSPLTLITASVDRRTGKFIRIIFDNHQRRDESFKQT
ncbi:hypothetical protein [Asticcacaulis biprosthecium]|uniref:hypothetical protein n=1 Tax=Asticcacaulis biprosthecium TaxID=76891 RepID=UPI00058DD23A|nr:hypothetical protein [Asticcacaulis biprosthecium]